jgi:hypothetical protein
MFADYRVVNVQADLRESVANIATTTIHNFLGNGEGWKFVSITGDGGGVFITFGRFPL